MHASIKGKCSCFKIFGIVIIGLLVVFLISNSSKAQSQQTTRPVYEYKILEIGTSINEEREQQKLNQLGLYGWQVVGVGASARSGYIKGTLYIILMRKAEPTTIGDTEENSNSGLVGDLDNDGDVDFADFLVFVENFGKTLTG